uniref:Putative mucin 30e n=1 Tax=Culex tarsalis TaxID=7177 RepID=A0A1Q3FW68_CULTA
MNENLTKICRICLTEGSRNIFQRTVSHDALYNVSSLSRISEKLRYVTLLKIDEMENLPPMICDLCIVQLNVAYNFKRQASESDTKLRQYLIENGIDIMKDPLSLPAPIVTSPPAPSNPTAPTSSILRPAAIVAAPNHSRTIARINSTASSAVLEIRPVNRNAEPLQQNAVPHQLRPIRIKVETPDTATEQSSEAGELLSNSEISPLSSVTATAVPIAVVEEAASGASKTVTVDSSPASSKSGGAMVVVSSENVSMQGDEDFVQNILGSNSSIASRATESDKQQEVAAAKGKASSSSTEQNKRRDPLKALLSKLTIDMVSSAKLPKSKLRTKPKKPQKSVANPAINRRKRHSLDYSQLFAKRSKANESSPATGESPERRRNPVARRSGSNVISANRLRSLGEKIRAEKESGGSGGKAGEESKRRKAFVQLDSGETVKGERPSASRVSLP